VEYPRPVSPLAEDWTKRSGLLVAVHEGETIGYISLNLHLVPRTTWVTDMVVIRRLRRQGIGSALILAAQAWGSPTRYPQVGIRNATQKLPGYPDGAQTWV
jgi:GNAT superfamily N-acetyltransferase